MATRTKAGIWAVAFAAVTAACQSTKEPKSADAVSELRETRAELVAARGDVQRALSDLEALRAEQHDIRAPYERVREDRDAIEASFRSVRDETDDLRQDATDYRREWSEATAALTDPALRESAEQRNERVRERYEQVEDKAAAAKRAYQPFIQRLRELETYLANDLTPAAVRGAEPSFDEAQQEGEELIRLLDETITEIEGLVLEMNSQVRGG